MNTVTLHWNTLKEQGRLEQWEGKATHWRVSMKFHLLCHCLTNCFTYCKHSSQQLYSKWGLHTPFRILRPMCGIFFPLKFLFIVSLLRSLNFGFPFQTSHQTGRQGLERSYRFPLGNELHLSHQNICESLMRQREGETPRRFKWNDSVGIIMSCKEAWNQSIQHHAPLWFNHGLGN